MLLHALSVDVEEHFQVEAFAEVVSFADWTHHASRVVDNTIRILDIFGEFGVRATFFVVGWVAERHPDLIKRIAAAGHEIGCHSYRHSRICRLQPAEFKEDTRRGLDTLSSIAGQPILGYRAPTFSVTDRSLWCLQILQESGLQYDSSVFPIRHDLYGIPNAPRRPFLWKLANGATLTEFPASTVEIGALRLPAAGGGYLRILPAGYTNWAIRRLENEHMNAMVYFHPWEVDAAQPRINAGWKSILRHYTNLAGFENRLRGILKKFRFAPLHQVLEQCMASEPLAEYSVERMQTQST